MEEEPSYCTYADAYEINCARFGRETDLPIVQYKKRLAGPDGTFLPDPQGQLRLGAFQEICDKMVSENVFSQYIYKTLPTCNHLWVFKKYFCTQMALSGDVGSHYTLYLYLTNWEIVRSEGSCDRMLP